MKDFIDKLNKSQSEELKRILIALSSYVSDIRNDVGTTDDTRRQLLKLIDEQIITRIDSKFKEYGEEDKQEFI